MDNFDLEYCNGLVKYSKKGIDCEDAKTYIKDFFYPLITGKIAIVEENKLFQRTKAVIKKVYFDKLPKEISKWFFFEYCDLFEVIKRDGVEMIVQHGKPQNNPDLGIDSMIQDKDREIRELKELIIRITKNSKN